MQRYLNLLSQIMEYGEDVQTRAYLPSEDRKPMARSLFAMQFRHDLAQGFPAVTTKKLFFHNVVKEMLWFLRGESNVKNLGCKIWDSWSNKDTGACGPIYGSMWRFWPFSMIDDGPDWAATDDNGPDGYPGLGYHDQISRIVRELKEVAADPFHSARRRIILSAWNPPVVPLMGLPPCHTLAQWLPVNGKLKCHCFWRSIDAPVGMPFNIAQYALLTHMLAAVAGFTPGEFTASITDLHIYDNQHDLVKEQLKREPYPSPRLVMPDLASIAPNFTMEEIKRLSPDQFSLDGYQSYPPLKCEVAV